MPGATGWRTSRPSDLAAAQGAAWWRTPRTALSPDGDTHAHSGAHEPTVKHGRSGSARDHSVQKTPSFETPYHRLLLEPGAWASQTSPSLRPHSSVEPLERRKPFDTAPGGFRRMTRDRGGPNRNGNHGLARCVPQRRRAPGRAPVPRETVCSHVSLRDFHGREDADPHRAVQRARAPCSGGSERQSGERRDRQGRVRDRGG